MILAIPSDYAQSRYGGCVVCEWASTIADHGEVGASGFCVTKSRDAGRGSYKTCLLMGCNVTTNTAGGSTSTNPNRTKSCRVSDPVRVFRKIMRKS